LIEEARRRPDLPILTGKAVAAILHIGTKQVYAHITSGALCATKLGPRTLRIAFGDLLSFVADHQVGHTISILDRLDTARVTERSGGKRGRLTTLRDAPDRLAG